jgi:hypothetical protein
MLTFILSNNTVLDTKTHKTKSGTLLRKIYVNRSVVAPEYGYLKP